MAGQEALEKKLALVETHQKEIHDTLSSMEGEAERLYREERNLLDDDSRCALDEGGPAVLDRAGGRAVALLGGQRAVWVC